MMMERLEIIGLMAELKLAGMRHAYDEVIADALTGMLFTPSLKGRSHSFDEDTRREHLVLGCRLAAAAVSRYNQAECR